MAKFLRQSFFAKAKDQPSLSDIDEYAEPRPQNTDDGEGSKEAAQDKIEPPLEVPTSHSLTKCDSTHRPKSSSNQRGEKKTKTIDTTKGKTSEDKMKSDEKPKSRSKLPRKGKAIETRSKSKRPARGKGKEPELEVQHTGTFCTDSLPARP